MWIFIYFWWPKGSHWSSSFSLNDFFLQVTEWPSTIIMVNGRKKRYYYYYENGTKKFSGKQTGKKHTYLFPFFFVYVYYKFLQHKLIILLQQQKIKHYQQHRLLLHGYLSYYHWYLVKKIFKLKKKYEKNEKWS